MAPQQNENGSSTTLTWVPLIYPDKLSDVSASGLGNFWKGSTTFWKSHITLTKGSKESSPCKRLSSKYRFFHARTPRWGAPLGSRSPRRGEPRPCGVVCHPRPSGIVERPVAIECLVGDDSHTPRRTAEPPKRLHAAARGPATHVNDGGSCVCTAIPRRECN